MSVDSGAAAGIGELADATLKDAPAAVGRGAAVETEGDAGPGGAERAALGAGPPAGPSPSPRPTSLNPATPQISGTGQVPHWITSPQPSPLGPQEYPAVSQERGLQSGIGPSGRCGPSMGPSFRVTSLSASVAASGLGSPSKRPVRLPHA